MLIDTHCHLFFDKYDSDLDSVLKRSKESKVETLINVGIDLSTNQSAIQLAGCHDYIKATVGMHPHSAHEVNKNVKDELFNQINSSTEVVAVGEVGLDYYKSEADRSSQIYLFEKAVELALETKLPLIVHSRNAFKDTISILKKAKEKDPTFKAVFHCFTYGVEEMREIVDLGLFISFTGIVTFKNAGELVEVVREVPETNFFIETDSPYLAPVPQRGKRNEPSFLEHTANFISQIRGVSFEDIAKLTTRSAKQFFNLN